MQISILAFVVLAVFPDLQANAKSHSQNMSTMMPGDFFAPMVELERDELGEVINMNGEELTDIIASPMIPANRRSTQKQISPKKSNLIRHTRVVYNPLILAASPGR